jgi:hypothetical protein
MFCFSKSILVFVLKSVLISGCTFENPFGNFCLRSVLQHLKLEKYFWFFCQTTFLIYYFHIVLPSIANGLCIKIASPPLINKGCRVRSWFQSVWMCVLCL